MTTIRISNPFPPTLSPPPAINKPTRLFIARAAAGDDEPSSQADEDEKEKPSPTSAAATAAVSDQSFENRLAQVRLKYRSGTGRKAEKRKSKKSGRGSTGDKKSGAVMLPPVPLKEPVTARGLKVELGFTPYSEMLNGRVAGLGLAALVLVELGSGKGLLSYHAWPILFIQVYTVAAAAALLIKFERERISIWPEKTPASTESSEP